MTDNTTQQSVMTTHAFNLNSIDPSWHECIIRGLSRIDLHYLQQLLSSHDWLPGKDKIFNAFSLPLDQVNYVLFGESPYPRKESANGYAFWDAAVTELWSPTGLSKKVNRATSLRNILKMLLIAEYLLDKNHTGQDDIAAIDKTSLVQTCDELFGNFIRHGILLLNATPVLHSGPPQKDAKAWHPFTGELMNCLLQKRPDVKFILLGKIAKTVDQLMIHQKGLKKLYAEHPYNLSFITNQEVSTFFKPMHLLIKKP